MDAVPAPTYLTIAHGLLHAVYLLTAPRLPSAISAGTPDARTVVLQMHAGVKLLWQAMDMTQTSGGRRAVGLLRGVVSLGAMALIWRVQSRWVRVLLQVCPRARQLAMQHAQERLATLEGVVECAALHAWEEAVGGPLVATLVVSVLPSACKTDVLNKTRALFEGVVDDLTVQMETWRG